MAVIIGKIGAVLIDDIVFKGGIPVGNSPDSLFQKFLGGITGYAGPLQFDFCVRIGQLGAQSKGIDGRGYAVDRIGSHIANAIILAHGTGNGAGDKLSLIDAAVIGAHGSIGLVKCAVQKPHLGIFHRCFHTGLNQLRCCGKDHLCPVRYSLLNQLSGYFRSVGIVVSTRCDRLTQSLLQISAAMLMGTGPVAGIPAILMNKGHIQMIHALEYLQDLAFFFRRLCLDHGLRYGSCRQIRPKLGNGLFQFSGA